MLEELKDYVKVTKYQTRDLRACCMLAQGNIRLQLWVDL